MENKILIRCPDPKSRFNFWEMKEVDTDLLICCSITKDENVLNVLHSKGVSAHNIILSASSDFFRQELKKKMEYHGLLQLSDITKEEFLPILEFIYRGEVTIESKNYQNFVRVAKCLSIRGLEHLWKSNEMLQMELSSTKVNQSTSKRTIEEVDISDDDIDTPPPNIVGKVITSKRQKIEQSVSTESQNIALSELKTETKVTDLPKEILSKIFQNLSTTELLQKVAHVSKHFHQVTKCPDSHRRISMQIKDNMEGASDFLKQATLIESLYIKIEVKKCKLTRNKIKNDPQTQHQLDPLLESLVNHHQLRHINIVSIDRYVEEPEYIPKNGIITRHCIAKLGQSTWWSKLKTVILPITNESDYNKQSNTINVQFDKAINLLKLSGNIRRLSISGLSRAEESSLIMSCRDLKSLTINQYYQQSEIIPFLQKIKSTVEELDFGCNLYGEWLYPLVSKFSNLKIFKQSDNLYHDITYQKDETKILVSKKYFDFGDYISGEAEGELLQEGYGLDGDLGNIPPFQSFNNLNNLTSIEVTFTDQLNGSYEEMYKKTCLPNVTELRVYAFSESAIFTNVVTNLADMFPNLETYWFVAEKCLQATEMCFASLFQTPRKLKDFRLTDRRRDFCRTRIDKSDPGVKDLLSNLWKHWPQLKCFVWCGEAPLEKHLFKCANTLLVKSANLKVIGTHKTLFVKPSVTKEEILSLAMTTEFTKIKRVQA